MKTIGRLYLKHVIFIPNEKRKLREETKNLVFKINLSWEMWKKNTQYFPWVHDNKCRYFQFDLIWFLQSNRVFRNTIFKSNLKSLVILEIWLVPNSMIFTISGSCNLIGSQQHDFSLSEVPAIWLVPNSMISNISGFCNLIGSQDLISNYFNQWSVNQKVENVRKANSHLKQKPWKYLVFQFCGLICK